MKLVTVLLTFIFILAQSLFKQMVSKYCSIYCQHECIVYEDFRRCHYYMTLNGGVILIRVS